MPETISYVVFDVGNVLIEWDPNHLYIELIPDAGERTAFLTDICTMDWNLEQDRGRSWEEATRELQAKYPETAELIAAYSDRWHDMVPGDISGSVEILNQLKASGVPLYAITNFSREKWSEAGERFPFLTNSFIDVVVSAHEEVVKPDARIYEILLERNGLTAENGVFIDDSPKNVEGARAVGLKAVHFGSSEQLREDLKAMGLPL